MKSKITGGRTSHLFRARVLNKYEVDYFRCEDTGFIQTEEPYWLEEAYAEAISELDVGLVHRGVAAARLSMRLIDRVHPHGELYLDFGGGVGLFAQLMRANGYPFLLYDPHCESLLSRGVSVERLERADGRRYDWLTAWEVVEHLPDPFEAIGTILRHADRVLFSTLLVPETRIERPDDWWYFAPVTGQHVSFHTRRSLECLARTFEVHYYGDANGAYHLFTREALPSDPFRVSWRERLGSRLVQFAGRVAGRRSDADREKAGAQLREQDFQNALQRLRGLEVDR